MKPEQDARGLVLNVTMTCMSSIFPTLQKESFRQEADKLMAHWVQDHPHFGTDGIVEAVLWWQERATENNPYPLSQPIQ